MTLGGKTDPALGGGPLTLTGEVVCLTNGRFIAYGPMGGGIERDYGPSMVFRSAASTSSSSATTARPSISPSSPRLGIEPTRYRTVAVKSMQHFRAAFEPIAREVVLVDTGALCSENYAADRFVKVRRPVWPLDPIADPDAST